MIKRNYLKSYVSTFDGGVAIGIIPSKLLDKGSYSNSNEKAFFVEKGLFSLEQIGFSESEVQIIHSLIEESKKCSHENQKTEEKTADKDRKTVYTYCEKCRLVLHKKNVDGPKTKTLVDLSKLDKMIRVEEQKVKSLEESLVNSKQHLEELKKIREKVKESIS